MAKASGGTRLYSPSKSLAIYKNMDGGDIPKLSDNKSHMMMLYEDYKTNKKAGYDVSDESWNFITKSGKFHSANEFDELPKIKKSDILFMEQYTSEGSTAWYDKSVKDYKEKIQKATAYVVK